MFPFYPHFSRCFFLPSHLILPDIVLQFYSSILHSPILHGMTWCPGPGEQTPLPQLRAATDGHRRPGLFLRSHLKDHPGAADRSRMGMAGWEDGGMGGWWFLIGGSGWTAVHTAGDDIVLFSSPTRFIMSYNRGNLNFMGGWFTWFIGNGSWESRELQTPRLRLETWRWLFRVWTPYQMVFGALGPLVNGSIGNNLSWGCVMYMLIYLHLMGIGMVISWDLRGLLMGLTFW